MDPSIKYRFCTHKNKEGILEETTDIEPEKKNEKAKFAHSAKTHGIFLGFAVGSCSLGTISLAQAEQYCYICVHLSSYVFGISLALIC